MTETRCRTLVVGGGPAGLAQAFWTSKADPDHDVVVIEAAERAGGWVHSLRKDGFTLELGPQALRPSDTLDAIIEALGIGADVVPASAGATVRWIGRRGKLVPLPAGPGQFFGSAILPLRSKLRVFAEPFVKRAAPPDPRESVASFVGRRFGKRTEPLVHAMVSGIFAGDADALEMRSAFPIMTELEAAHGSVFKGFMKKAKAAKAQRNGAPRKQRPPLVSFHGGLQRLTDAMADALGERIRVGQRAVSVVRDDDMWRVATAAGDEFVAPNLVMASPARVTAKLLEKLDPVIAKDLAAIPFASVTSVYLTVDGAVADANPNTCGFGFLLEPAEGSPVLGCLYCSHLFPEHAPAGRSLIRVMMGGVRNPGVGERGDAAVSQLAESTLRRYTGLTGDVDVVHVARVHDAIPQFVKGHGEILDAVGRRLAERWPGLELRGNSYRAVALTGQLGKPAGAPERV